MIGIDIAQETFRVPIPWAHRITSTDLPQHSLGGDGVDTGSKPGQARVARWCRWAYHSYLTMAIVTEPTIEADSSADPVACIAHRTEGA